MLEQRCLSPPLPISSLTSALLPISLRTVKKDLDAEDQKQAIREREEREKVTPSRFSHLTTSPFSIGNLSHSTKGDVGDSPPLSQPFPLTDFAIAHFSSARA